MATRFDFKENIDIAWCPGCGNFNILKSVSQALDELDLSRDDVVFVSGIGQAAKLPQYLKVSYFNGLHGRSLPVATAVKSSNPALTVIAESGDGCTYGEGGNHFIHTVRRNPDITNIVHNNMVYGLTKGQASPTSRPGFQTPVQLTGVYLEPLNPLLIAISHGATFVARTFSGDMEKTKEIIKQAVRHKGYSLVDIFQPCVSFNKVNTYKWYKDNSYYLEDNYDPSDIDGAIKKALEQGPFPLGILYRKENVPTFGDNLVAYRDSDEPLFRRTVNWEKLEQFALSMK
ncbi:MAG: thiamine pyrophosphate-dependent enzyme [Spirochaetota bacterium]